MFLISSVAVFLLFSHFAVATLFPPGEVCSGETITYNCKMLSKVTMWEYSGFKVGTVYKSQSVDTESSIIIARVVFTLTRESSNNKNELNSSVTFIADSAMDGQSIACIGDGGFDNDAIVHVRTDDYPPILSKIDVVDVVNKNSTATFTVEWSTINMIGEFSIHILPFPVSLLLPPVSLSLISSIVNVNLLYDINYTLTVEATNCAGRVKSQLNLMRGNCSVPPLATDVVLLPFQDTTEGATLIFVCGPPSEMTCTRRNQSVSWLPNPATHKCVKVACGPPLSPPDGFMEVNTSHIFMEGDNVSFQCQSGLSSDEVFTATCLKSIDNIGAWKPNPVLMCYHLDQIRCAGQDESAISGGASFLAGTLFGCAIGAGIVLAYFYYIKKGNVRKKRSSSRDLQLTTDSLPSHDSTARVIRPTLTQPNREDPIIRSILKKTQRVDGQPRIAGTRNNLPAPSVTIRANV